MHLMRCSLTKALGLALLPMAAWASGVEPDGGNPPTPYRDLRPQLLAALRDCTSPLPLALCEPASQRLQELITLSERPTARDQRPRCLGALTLLETHLTVFRWGFEPRQHLDPVIQQVEQACPAPLRAAPAASS